jgi:hypothetical protein
VGLLNDEVKGRTEDCKQWKCKGDCIACCAVLYCTVLYCAVLCCAVLCCAVLYCAVLYCNVLYSTLLCLHDLHEFYVFPSSGVIVWILFQYILYIIELWAVIIIRIYLCVL